MSGSDGIQLHPIGRVRSPVTSTEIDVGFSAVVSTIALDPRYAAGLDGLADFSHAVIVFWMQHDFVGERDLVRHPRGRTDMPRVGIFAQRGKQRPNPIGVTVAEILAIEGSTLTVRGLDAVDGTPVLDVKPYFPAFDRPNAPRTPEWVELLMTGY